MSDLDNEELIATRRLQGLNDNLFKEGNDTNVGSMTEEAFNELIDNFEVVAHLTMYGRKGIKENVKKLQARIKELEEECNKKNKTIETMRYIKGINNQENIYLLDESMCIEKNKYLLEVNNGEFIDVNELYRMCKNSIPVQKVKETVKEVIELIESEQFKIIMGDMTKVGRIKYLLKKLLEEK